MYINNSVSQLSFIFTPISIGKHVQNDVKLVRLDGKDSIPEMIEYKPK